MAWPQAAPCGCSAPSSTTRYGVRVVHNAAASVSAHMPGAPHPARPESPGAQQSHDGEARVGSCKLLLPEQWTFFVRVGADGGEVTVARWLTPCVYSVDRDKRSAGLYLKDTFHTTLHWSTSKLIVILVLMYARVCLVQGTLGEVLRTDVVYAYVHAGTSPVSWASCRCTRPPSTIATPISRRG